MLPELPHFAAPLLIGAAALVLAALATTLTDRLPIPAPALFLVGAALAATAVPSLHHDVSILTVERVAVVALIVILFNGGRDLGASALRRSLGDIASVGLLGTFLTAAGLTLAAHAIVHLDWKVAGVLGAALAPTDPAVMFSVLGRREVGGRSGTVLEGEAGINDPAGIALLLGLLQVATHPHTSLLVVLKDFVFAMGIGIGAGLIGARLLITTLQRVRLGDSGLHPVLALTWAGVLYGAATLLDGSGFVAVFTLGLLVGDRTLPYADQITHVSASLASLAEVAAFLVLGITIDLQAIPISLWLEGLALFGAMALLVRPPVVLLTLACSRLSRRERAFVAWSGLKGAVPILLGAFAALAHVAHHAELYKLIFVVVLASVVLQGGLVPAVATRLGIQMRTADRLPYGLGVALAEPPQQRVQHTVAPGSAADGRPLDALPLDDHAAVTLVRRDARALPPRPDLVLAPGDVVSLLGVEDDATLERLFSADG